MSPVDAGSTGNLPTLPLDRCTQLLRLGNALLMPNCGKGRRAFIKHRMRFLAHAADRYDLRMRHNYNANPVSLVKLSYDRMALSKQTGLVPKLVI